MKFRNKFILAFGAFQCFFFLVLCFFFLYLKNFSLQTSHLMGEWRELRKIYQLESSLEEIQKNWEQKNRKTVFLVIVSRIEKISIYLHTEDSGPSQDTVEEKRKKQTIEEIQKEVKNLMGLVKKWIHSPQSQKTEKTKKEFQASVARCVHLIKKFKNINLRKISQGVELIEGYTAQGERILVIYLVGSLLLSILVYHFLQNALFFPFKNLYEKITQIVRKNLPIGPPSQGDEMEELMSDMERVSCELADYYHHLQKKVDEKTAILVRAEKLANLGQLASGVAHEINNPLSSVLTASESLLRKIKGDTLSPETLLEYMELIREETLRCREITKSLLSLARKEPSATRKPLSLADLIEKVAHTLPLLCPAVERKKIQITSHFEEDLPTIQANPSQLHQVFFNLLKNSLDALDMEGTLSIKGRKKLGGVEIVIEDNGEGIEPEKLEHIFDPFFTTKEAGKGSGLGLVVCLAILESHRGQIQIESPGKGQGTKTTLFFGRESSEKE